MSESRKSYFDTLKFTDGDRVDKLIPFRFIQYINYDDNDETLFIHLEGKTLEYKCSPQIGEKGVNLYQEWVDAMDYSEDALNNVRKGVDTFLEDAKAEMKIVKDTFEADLAGIRQVAEQEFSRTIEQFNTKAEGVITEGKTLTTDTATEIRNVIDGTRELVESTTNKMNEKVDTMNAIIDHYDELLMDKA